MSGWRKGAVLMATPLRRRVRIFGVFRFALGRPILTALYAADSKMIAHFPSV